MFRLFVTMQKVLIMAFPSGVAGGLLVLLAGMLGVRTCPLLFTRSRMATGFPVDAQSNRGRMDIRESAPQPPLQDLARGICHAPGVWW
jgi:hypothetical protein